MYCGYWSLYSIVTHNITVTLNYRTEIERKSKLVEQVGAQRFHVHHKLEQAKLSFDVLYKLGLSCAKLKLS